MTTKILEKGVKIALEFVLHGKTITNIYHVVTSQTPTLSKLVYLSQLFKDWWITYQADNVGAGVLFQGVVATDISVPNGAQYLNVVSPQEPGRAAGLSQPANVAVVATLRTAQIGRSFRGRSYMAGFTDNQVTANSISSALATDIVIDHTILIDDIAQGGDNLVVASFYSNGAPRVTGLGTPVTTIDVGTRVDTQRRRLPQEI